MQQQYLWNIAIQPSVGCWLFDGRWNKIFDNHFEQIEN